MDRKKVIKALQNCSVQNDVGCQGCPYFEERKTYGHEWCTTSMAQDALELLKEQEAVKPKSKSRHGEYPQIVHRCGNCNEILYRHYKFCPMCGRSVKLE